MTDHKSMAASLEAARTEAATAALANVVSYLRMKGHNALADELIAEFSEEPENG